MKYLYPFIFVFVLFGSSLTSYCQENATVYVKDTKAAARQRLYKTLTNNTINKNLSLPLADSTEENWIDAFYALELTRYKSAWVETKIRSAFNDIVFRSDGFKKALAELVYSNYPNIFTREINQLLSIAEEQKLFAICAEYLLANSVSNVAFLKKAVNQKLIKQPQHPILLQLFSRLDNGLTQNKLPSLKDILHHSFFDTAVVIYSFQRKNRDYPGITIIRDTASNFVKDQYGNIFTVTQLARSISNLPGYISNGNTPQGIFRMFGTAVSKSNFIGPTPNIQLTMPFETSIQHFMNDSSIADTTWTIEWYRKLFPKSWKAYVPILEAYYAGNAGRTEIIAHGTTVDPNYYKGQTYYPLTPTLGCLCTKEIWNEDDGSRQFSDQQKLMDALQKAGGANGYYIVIELNNEQRPVTNEDILPLLKQ